MAGGKVYPVEVTGQMAVNSYFYVDEGGGHAFLVDPGAEGGSLLDMAEARGWTVDGILLTHGHYDHIGGIAAIRSRRDISVHAHEASSSYLLNPEWNLSRYNGGDIVVQGAIPFQDGDKLALAGGSSLTVIHTPGHTADSVIFYDEAARLALTGDTIFRHSVGRTDFPGGSFEKLSRSILNRVFALPDDITLYSGHTAPTTVAEEKRWHGR